MAASWGLRPHWASMDCVALWGSGAIGALGARHTRSRGPPVCSGATCTFGSVFCQRVLGVEFGPSRAFGASWVLDAWEFGGLNPGGLHAG
jgi:hypothetical protein